MSKYALFLVSLIFGVEVSAASGQWDFHYQQSHCYMSVSDSLLTEKELPFSYAIVLQFSGERHANADKILTKTPVLNILPQLLLTQNPLNISNANHLTVNGIKLNSALTPDGYHGEKLIDFLNELAAGKPVVGVAEFPNGSTIQWTFNNNDFSVNNELFKVCMAKST